MILLYWGYACLHIIKARVNERNMLCQQFGHNMLRFFAHHVGLCCMMSAYVAYNQVVAFPCKVIVFCNYVYGFVTFSLTFPSALFILSVLVNLTGSISKMAENNSNSNSDAFCVFIVCIHRTPY